MERQRRLFKIAIWSLFRDSAGEHIARYKRRALALDYPPELLRFYLVEGDSVDNTLAELQEWAVVDDRVTVLKCDTGKPRHGSTVHPQRFEILEAVGNTAVKAIAADPWPELAMLIESDLEYMPDTLNRLLKNRKGAVIAPMIWISVDANTHRFYDIWAFRYLGGEMFSINTGAWYMSRHPEPFEVESVGSMVIFPIHALRGGACYDDQVIRGMCLKAAEQGYKIFCDTTTHVLHPNNH